jgi:TRAP-type C4-dicarboxylate transport system substrate-binding protein
MKASLAAGAAALALAAPAGAQVVLNAASWLPPAQPVTVTMGNVCQDMEKATAGRVRCNILPKHPVAPPQTWDAVQNGIIDLSFGTHGYVPGRFTVAEAIEFPFMGDSAQVNSVAYQRVYERMLARYDEHKGVVALTMFTHGPGAIFNTKRAVASLKDLQGMKLRVGSPIVIDIMNSLGAVPMLKPVSEVYELMSSGVADGTAITKDSPMALKFIPLVKHATYIPGGLYTQSFAWIANPAKWNTIPEADRKAIQPLLGETLARRTGSNWDGADEKGTAALRDAKVAMVTANPAFVAEIKARTQSLERSWVETKAKPKGIDGAAVLQALRDEIARVTDGK